MQTPYTERHRITMVHRVWNNAGRARVPSASITFVGTGNHMIRYFKGTLLAAVSIAFAGVAIAENPPATSTQQTTDQQTTSPASASSPHQRQRTHEQANEASPTANAPTDTDPSASSTRHQRETTGVRTAKSKAEKDQMMKDCVEQAQASNSSMSEDQAMKSCKDQMKSSERTGGG